MLYEQVILRIKWISYCLYFYLDLYYNPFVCLIVKNLKKVLDIHILLKAFKLFNNLRNFVKPWLVDLRIAGKFHLLLRPFNSFPDDKFHMLPNWKSLQTTISTLMKLAENSPNLKKTLWEKEKLLIMSNFSFSHSVFKKLVLQTYLKPRFVWERVSHIHPMSDTFCFGQLRDYYSCTTKFPLLTTLR